MVKVGEREYKTVFEDYPYPKLFDSLGNGIVELETNSFEVGQIYIFIRKGHYLHSIPSEDLEIVEKILPMQLKHMFGEGNPKRDMTMRDARPTFTFEQINIRSLDISDSFIMSCYELEGESLNHRFKYSDISAILSFFNTFPGLTRGSSTKQSQFQGLVMKHFGKENFTGVDMVDWAYVFKIPVNPLTRAFMNWTKNPFV